jgi:hypothetical protein
MKSLFFSIGVVSIFLAVIPYDFNVRSKNEFPIMNLVSPKKGICLSEKHVRLTAVCAGETAQGSIKIKNEGKFSISDITILSGCRCSSSNLSSTTINPGESIDIDFSVNTNGKTGDFTNTFIIRYIENGEKMFEVFYVTVPILDH